MSGPSQPPQALEFKAIRTAGSGPLHAVVGPAFHSTSPLLAAARSAPPSKVSNPQGTQRKLFRCTLDMSTISALLSAGRNHRCSRETPKSTLPTGLEHTTQTPSSIGFWQIGQFMACARSTNEVRHGAPEVFDPEQERSRAVACTGLLAAPDFLSLGFRGLRATGPRQVVPPGLV